MRTIAIDTETELSTMHEPVPRLVSAAIAYGDTRRCILRTHHDAAGELAQALELAMAGQALLVFANAPFDLNVIGRYLDRAPGWHLPLYEAQTIRDVLTRDRMLSVAYGEFLREFDLGTVADRRAGIRLGKDDPWRKRYGELYDARIEDWPADARRYAIRDAAATLRVYEEQEKLRHDGHQDVLADEARQAFAHFALYAQQIEGIRTDAAQLARVEMRLRAEKEACTERMLASGLLRWVGPKCDPKRKLQRDTKRARDMARDAGCDVLTATGQVSTSKDALATLHLADDHPLAALRSYLSIDGLISRTVESLRPAIVRTSYVEYLETGRTGSRSPNLQNLPRSGGFREVLVPRPGNVFVVSDFSGAELVTWAQANLDMFGDSPMADRLCADRQADLHSELGAELLGIPYTEFDRKRPEHARARGMAKPTHFGYQGGMGPDRMVEYARSQYGVEMTRDQAAHARDVWDRKWKGRRYLDAVSRTEEPDGTYKVVTPRSNRVRRGCRFTEAANTRFQSLAADAAKEALIELHCARYDKTSPLYDIPQVLFVHDENVSECPRERAEAVLAEQERIMIAAFRKFCPDVPVRVESEIEERYRSK